MIENFDFDIESDDYSETSSQDGSFLIAISAKESCKDSEVLSHLSMPSSPRRRLSFGFKPFEVAVRNIDSHYPSKQPKRDDNILKSDQLSKIMDIANKETKKRGRPKGSIKIKKCVQASLKTDCSIQQETDRSIDGKETGKSYINRRIGKVRTFWNNTSMCYPFTFRKIYYILNNKNKRELDKICEEDLSGRLISYFDLPHDWE